MPIPNTIFRAYDIRGTYPDLLTDEHAELVGKAFGTRLIRKGFINVVVGSDNRTSSWPLRTAVIRGLVSTGCQVTDAGLIVQPALHHFTFLPEFDAGVNITASHNPKEYNGIKLEYKNSNPCFGEELQELYQQILQKDFIQADTGTVTKKDRTQNYIDFISSRFSFHQKITVAIYCGNAVTGICYPQILEKLGLSVVKVNCNLDSTFPEGIPDPEGSKAFKKLIPAVIDKQANIGFAFDGDGDRIGVIDHLGTKYKTDELLMLFSQEILARNPGAKIIYDVKSSALLEEVILENKGKPVMMRTGRGYFLEEMFTGGALAGAELAGHIYFMDGFYGYDDGIYAACRILDIMNKTGKSLRELMSQFPKLENTQEVKITCPDELKFQIVDEIAKKVKKDTKFQRILDIDGVRAYTDKHSWFLIRASNTSPYLSIRLEAPSKEDLLKQAEQVENLLTPYTQLNAFPLKDVFSTSSH
jgi:phosphomannomutase/phosphoglucomutase